MNAYKIKDRMTGEIVSSHKSYETANKKASKMGNRYTIVMPYEAQ